MELTYWERIVGKSKSQFQVRDKLHNELNLVHQELQRTRTRVSSLVQQELEKTRKNVDDTWEVVKTEFRRIETLRAKAIEEMKQQMKDEIELSRADLNAMKEGAKKKARSIWFSFWFYVQLIVFVGPVLALAGFMILNHPKVFLLCIFYLACLFGFLLWSLVVPSMSHRGIRMFKPYTLSEEEQEIIDRTMTRITERSKGKKKQGYWSKEDREKPVFVLSLDGGGIKGAVTARILERICERFPGFMDEVGLIAGCSTGSILGGMLATGFTPTEVRELFVLGSPVVFRTTVWEQLKQFGLLSGPNHDGSGKLEILQKAFRGLRMSELNTGLCITASHVDEEEFKDNHCAPRIWSNVVKYSDNMYSGHHEFDEVMKAEIEKLPIQDMYLADVVNGATAAPIYYPSHQNHVDGALWCNNPSMAALAHITPVRELKHVKLLSISTGLHVPEVKCKPSDWGVRQWLPWIVDFLFNGPTKASHFNCKAMLGDRYHRIDPILPRPVALNDVSACAELIEAADQVDLAPTFEFLRRMGFQEKDKRD